MKCLIVGCQRSGTTLLREVISTGNILIFDENWIASYFYRERFHAHKWRGCGWEYDDEDTKIWDDGVRSFLKYTYQNYFEKIKKPHHLQWGMKSPGLNMACAIPYLAKLIEKLQFVYVVREPRDTFASMKNSKQMLYSLPNNFYGDSINSPDLVALAIRPYEYWGEVNKEILSHREKMPERFYTLWFEKWMDNPVLYTKDICDFLQVPFNTDMLEPFTRKISQASVVSMEKEDFYAGRFVTKASAVGRWRYDLSSEEVDRLMKSSEHSARILGYL